MQVPPLGHKPILRIGVLLPPVLVLAMGAVNKELAVHEIGASPRGGAHIDQTFLAYPWDMRWEYPFKTLKLE